MVEILAVALENVAPPFGSRQRHRQVDQTWAAPLSCDENRLLELIGVEVSQDHSVIRGTSIAAKKILDRTDLCNPGLARRCRRGLHFAEQWAAAALGTQVDVHYADSLAVEQ